MISITYNQYHGARSLTEVQPVREYLSVKKEGFINTKLFFAVK